MNRFVVVENEIKSIAAIHIIGALSLDPKNLKLQLMHEAGTWKGFSVKLTYRSIGKDECIERLHESYKHAIETRIVDLDSLRYVINVLKEIRERESGIDRK